MCKPNTKLCILLEPKEFATNPIIEFCDQTFGKRINWIPNATFLMTKFDKQLEDSRTASKANNFFKEFHSNQCFPYLVITPTLRKEDIPTAELYKARKELLALANAQEKDRFNSWLSEHESFQQEINAGDEETLNIEIRNKLGFGSAKDRMRAIMLADTLERLPTVLESLRNELAKCEKEQKILLQKNKFSDPAHLRLVALEMWVEIRRRITDYLNGDLASSIKYPEKLQTLDDEIEEEDDSEWSQRDLNHLTEAENDWRTSIANLGEYPECVRAKERYFGGKQVQRAIEFFRAVMIEELPDPFVLKNQVANATGYLADGLDRENWERGMMQVATTCLKNGSPPGINYLIKHIGNILRRLFRVALDDVKQGEQFSAKFQLLPSALEKHLVAGFDEMLFSLLVKASEKTHCALEPKYSTVDPSLLTFSCKENEEMSKQTVEERIAAFAASTASACKNLLKKESHAQAAKKNILLPDNRSAMITDEEIMKILSRTFEYIVALMDFILKDIKFQVNHYLVVQFKKELESSFTTKLFDGTDWETLVEHDPTVKNRLVELEGQISGLTESLQEVSKLQRSF